MTFFYNIFYQFLYYPLLNALILLYNVLPGHDLGVAIIILTILVRIILWPFSRQSLRSQKSLQDLQPKIKEIQKRYQDNKEEQAKAMMRLYQESGVNPMSGCLPLIIQFPIFIALYRVFIKGLTTKNLVHLYSFVSKPASLNVQFLGIFDLTKPNLLLAVFAGILQFIQLKMISDKQPKMMQSGDKSQSGLLKQSDISQAMGKQMTYLMPLLIVFFLWKLPSALGLYFVITTAFSIVQQFLFYNRELESSK